MNEFLHALSELIWGWPLLSSIFLVGIYFSFKLKIPTWGTLKLSMKYITGDAIANDRCSGNVSVFASLCTALSATLGTGNIVGMAVAITIGGPGALFWLWASSIFCLALRYAESMLAVKYRKIATDGTVSGGPMYYMDYGLGSDALAKIFAVSGVLVALVGIGTFAQSNSIAIACRTFKMPPAATTAILTITVALVIVGGLKKIAVVAEKIVPIMTIFYIGSAAIVLLANIFRIPAALYSIFRCAFDPQSVIGGGAGISAAIAASVGVRRGIFSHEAGLGSSTIAAATARVDSAPKQGIASMIGALLSVVVCTMTGLVVLVSCDNALLFGSGALEGATLTAYAFSKGLHMAIVGEYVVSISIVFFAFTTIIGWNYYGEKCVNYIFGPRAIVPYKLLFLFFVAIGPFFRIVSIFALADIVVGIMAAVNLIGLVGLRSVIADETKEFFKSQPFKASK
ncbi:MAG: amino acid carrier protein [Puniceicoccales bacterium]|jgi:AGCS family alanine or glycine:cation symporter|nr:amino acid carrier protein [Puniceicoccales bacterium]